MKIKIKVEMDIYLQNQEDCERHSIELDEDDFVLMARNKLQKEINEKIVDYFNDEISLILK